MKILHITRSYYPNIGGIEKHIEEFSKLLMRNNEVFVLTEDNEGKLSNEEVYQGIKIHRIDTSGTNEKNKKWKIWKWMIKHKTWLQGFDVIHFHDVFFWIIPLLIFKLPKLFITFHGYEGFELPTLKQKFWHKLGEKLTVGNICVGGFYTKWYGTSPNYVIFGGVDPASKLNKSKNPKAIFIGRLQEDTGITEYIKSLKGTKLTLDVFGDGPQMEEAKKLAMELKVDVTFFGFVAVAADKVKNYKVAFVSRYLSILEAFISKVPVIAHYNNEIKYDYLMTTPFHSWVNIAHTSEEIRSNLEKITKDKKKTKTDVNAAYNWAKEQTWEKAAETYYKLWKLK
ncbi:MAG TPA: glycosyltransferase family 4 protein [Patescibacteria group bacterium]|nr:glycosyltransferase family 4 protein [Patescibacteria group bacterium]